MESVYVVSADFDIIVGVFKSYEEAVKVADALPFSYRYHVVQTAIYDEASDYWEHKANL